MPRRRKPQASDRSAELGVATIKHDAKRKNIPPAGLEAQGVVQKGTVLQHPYSPHFPPVLRSSSEPTQSDDLARLLEASQQRALTEVEAHTLAQALQNHQPWLEWSGKREKSWFSVDPVALHMHERVSTQAILRVLNRQDIQRDLFADPQHNYAQAVQFYQHDVEWTNRMILGDSLHVMASLARRESLAGKVQVIYFDPPYGIRFASNFQPRLGQRNVKDQEHDLTREPEMVKAYRDTWTLGVHSYLAYLRDRLILARELLTDSGSIFLQISDRNLHWVRCVLDEVFGSDNFRCIIAFRTTTGKGSSKLDVTSDFVLWYSRSQHCRMNPLFKPRSPQDDKNLRHIEWPDGSRLLNSNIDSINRATSEGARVWRQNPITSQTPSQSTVFGVTFEDRIFWPSKGGWKTNQAGMNRLHQSERLCHSGNTLGFVRYLDDFPFKPMNNIWDDTRQSGFGEKKEYVVQSVPNLIERCVLMTSDPGDLVLDPTCGSGTTAYVAEKWGRRWITIDTSRVALALAKHRILTAKFDYFRLRDLSPIDVTRNPDGTWIAEVDDSGRFTGNRRTFHCRSVSHVTLRSITRNDSLDPIFKRHRDVLRDALARLNYTLRIVSRDVKKQMVDKLIEKHRKFGATSVTNADTRRWLLPGSDPAWIKSIPARHPHRSITIQQANRYRDRIPMNEWHDWQVPFDSDPGWPKSLTESLETYRTAWRMKMDEVNACIRANAETEELIDDPEIVSGTVRVAGPFTVEGVIAVEDGADSPIGDAPDELWSFASVEERESLIGNAEAHLDRIIRLLKASGVNFADNRNMRFRKLEAVTGPALVHAQGEWLEGDGTDRRVAVSIGPEVGNVAAMQVEDAVRMANRHGFDDLVFAGFGFDASAQEAIQGSEHPTLRLHMALIRPDIAMDDLLKTQPGSQLFNVFSAPRVKGPERTDDGEFVLEVEGMDVYDPVKNVLYPTSRDRIAAWFLDSDYDSRTFCICQAFFPDRTKWDKLAKALKSVSSISDGAFDALSGFRSLPFARPRGRDVNEDWKVAVKIIDPRGNEGIRVLQVAAR